MLKLSEIYIYPIKSCAGISLQRAIVEERGLQFDRRWLLIDEKNRFLTQRQIPILALFHFEMQNDGFLVNFKDETSKIFIPFKEISQNRTKVKIWQDEVSVVLVDQKIDQWFSEILEQKVSLVYMDEVAQRQVDQKYAKNTEVSFADGYPFLIIGQSSLDDLNSRLEKPISINRFRPNFVFTGGQPYEEDDWHEISIGEADFTMTKPCSRCTITTIDQKTAETGFEPLKTLSKYRKKDQKVMFGMYMIANNKSVVNIDDQIRFGLP